MNPVPDTPQEDASDQVSTEAESSGSDLQLREPQFVRIPDPQQVLREPRGVQEPDPQQAVRKPDLQQVVQKKGKKLNLVDKSNLLSSIDEAVIEAVGQQIEGIDQDALAAITAAAREGIVSRLKASSRSVRGMQQKDFLKGIVEARNRLLRERKKLMEQLIILRDQMDEKREYFAHEQEQLERESAEGGSQQDHAMVRNIQRLFAELGELSPEMVKVQEQITTMALQSIHEERQKLVDSKMADHQKQVDQFERRIAKLTNSLELTETELGRIAKMKGIDHGVSSIYRNVQGLGSEDELFAMKRELLADIFEANMDLKKHLARSR